MPSKVGTFSAWMRSESMLNPAVLPLCSHRGLADKVTTSSPFGNQRNKTTALNTARTGSISAFQLSQQFGSFGLGSGFSHDFAPLHRLTLAFGHACRTI